ncbi:hypothetical protein [Stenotrophomonas sp. MMGLT7]|uniref:hypothetical protein n=1 Tax=Stenotrophomonas sp. MMGLT7 TaxID=2901227 RepID=UPI001E65422C|nr:hypothetical protein [Stenotrophomonas sp. MMGLT7]MCD7099398.1 hypothetical protein [Stenotrophomonas sp. MMGLT7]
MTNVLTRRVLDFLLIGLLFGLGACQGSADSGRNAVAEISHPKIKDNKSSVASTSDATVAPVKTGRVHALVEDSALRKYVDDSAYVIVEVDLNLDGRLDRVVSSAENAGNTLLFFINDGAKFYQALTSINLTEDGGRVLRSVSPTPTNLHPEVLKIETYFPQGEDEAVHYIRYADGGWQLSRTVYSVSDWRDHDGIRYVCEVSQDLPMADLPKPDVSARIKQLPEEEKRRNQCAEKSGG